MSGFYDNRAEFLLKIGHFFVGTCEKAMKNVLLWA